MKDEESAHSVRKYQKAAPPTEHEGTAQKRKAADVGQRDEPKRAHISNGLEEEERGDEEEARQSEGTDRAKSAVVTDEEDDLAQKNAIISRKSKTNLDVLARETEVGHEKEDATRQMSAPAAPKMRASSSKQSVQRGDSQPPPAGVPLSMNELEQAVVVIRFRKKAKRKLRFKCPFCEGNAKFGGTPAQVCGHFATHLRSEDKPYRCPWKGCQLTCARYMEVVTHFVEVHKQTWKEELTKESEVASVLHRLDVLQGQIAGRRGRLSFEELEEQARGSIVTGDAAPYRFQCSICRKERHHHIKAQLVREHLLTHLRDDCLPFVCPAKGCKHSSVRLLDIKNHFPKKHPAQKWTLETESASKVFANAGRLEAIVQGLLAAQPGYKRFTLDELEARAKESSFTRKAYDVLYLNCAECDESVKAPNGSRIREHLLTHLHRTNLPFRCPAEGCLHMTGSAKVLPSHFQSKHPLLRWTDDMAKNCEVVENRQRLESIVAMLSERRYSAAP